MPRPHHSPWQRHWDRLARQEPRLPRSASAASSPSSAGSFHEGHQEGLLRSPRPRPYIRGQRAGSFWRQSVSWGLLNLQVLTADLGPAQPGNRGCGPCRPGSRSRGAPTGSTRRSGCPAAAADHAERAHSRPLRVNRNPARIGCRTSPDTTPRHSRACHTNPKDSATSAPPDASCQPLLS